MQGGITAEFKRQRWLRMRVIRPMMGVRWRSRSDAVLDMLQLSLREALLPLARARKRDLYSRASQLDIRRAHHYVCVGIKKSFITFHATPRHQTSKHSAWEIPLVSYLLLPERSTYNPPLLHHPATPCRKPKPGDLFSVL